MDRIQDTGVGVVTSELLVVELAEAVLAIALKERLGRQWRRHRTDGRARRTARRLLNETADRYRRSASPCQLASGELIDRPDEVGVRSRQTKMPSASASIKPSTVRQSPAASRSIGFLC